MTINVSYELRCFWCNRPGAGDTGYGGCVKNGITFCWQSDICPFEVCGEILKKMDTMVDDYECPICMETKKALEMPRCRHKVCLDCYKTIYFGVSELEQPCMYRDLNLPIWTYDQQFDEDGEIMENEKKDEHRNFLLEKMNYKYDEDERPFQELIVSRDSLMCYRPDWMNIQEIINYENELFRIFTEWKIKESNYLASRTIGNQSCPFCRAAIEY
jgi:hypothetical protein